MKKTLDEKIKAVEKQITAIEHELNRLGRNREKGDLVIARLFKKRNLLLEKRKRLMGVGPGLFPRTRVKETIT